MLLGNWLSVCKTLKLDPCLSPCTKINSKWIKDLNKSLKLWNDYRKKIEKTLEYIGLGNYFLNKILIDQEIRARIDKWDYIKLKGFCPSKETITIIKRQPMEWDKIFTSYSTDKGLISRIYNEFKKNQWRDK
jgi:hypothetical protein